MNEEQLLLKEIKEHIENSNIKDDNGAWPQWFVGRINVLLDNSEEKTIEDVVKIDKEVATRILYKLDEVMESTEEYLLQKLFASNKKYDKENTMENFIEVVKYSALLLIYTKED